MRELARTIAGKSNSFAQFAVVRPRVFLLRANRRARYGNLSLRRCCRWSLFLPPPRHVENIPSLCSRATLWSSSRTRCRHKVLLSCCSFLWGHVSLKDEQRDGLTHIVQSA